VGVPAGKDNFITLVVAVKTAVVMIDVAATNEIIQSMNAVLASK